ncbi:MAG: hypothetical protein ABI091_22670 [Ferruginibacter sp.]
MTKFEIKGYEIRQLCKSLVLEFMQTTDDCKPSGVGIKQSQIFKNCGFDWGSFPLVTSSNQQYWIVAILSQLQNEGKVARVYQSGPWRLT